MIQEGLACMNDPSLISNQQAELEREYSINKVYVTSKWAKSLVGGGGRGGGGGGEERTNK